MKILIDSFIRDITKSFPMSKSEARRRLNEILKVKEDEVWGKANKILEKLIK